MIWITQEGAVPSGLGKRRSRWLVLERNLKLFIPVNLEPFYKARNFFPYLCFPACCLSHHCGKRFEIYSAHTRGQQIFWLTGTDAPGIEKKKKKKGGRSESV